MKIFLQMISIIMIFGIISVFSASHAKEGCPSLSCSLTSFHRGDLDRICNQQVTTAQKKGFTTITLVPAIEYDPGSKRIFPSERTMNRGELTRCLNVIWKSGMNLVYNPHLDSTATLNSDTEKDWRADFYVDPADPQYFESMFQEFEQFLGQKRADVLKSNRQVDVIIAAELEKSTTNFPSDWHKFARDMRKRHKRMGIDDKVRIGFNPNYWPTSNPSSEREYLEFRSFVKEMDFIAPSFYGNWNRLTHPKSTWKDVNINKAEILERLSRGGKVPEFESKPFAVGEFGAGGNFSATEKKISLLASSHKSFIAKRRVLYQNLMDWAANETSIRYSPSLALNIWTLGIHDPVNVSGSKGTIPDPDIESMFISYTMDNCGSPLKPTDTDIDDENRCKKKWHVWAKKKCMSKYRKDMYTVHGNPYSITYRHRCYLDLCDEYGCWPRHRVGPRLEYNW